MFVSKKWWQKVVLVVVFCIIGRYSCILCKYVVGKDAQFCSVKRIALLLAILPTILTTMAQKIQITIGGVTQSVTLADNAAARALAERLQQSAVTLTLNSSGGFEIWGALGLSLPASNEQMTARPGDVVLYNGSYICLFYGSNAWSYTRLGHIDDLTESELRTFLRAGESNIRVTLSVVGSTGIGQAAVTDNPSQAYTLQGVPAQADTKGVVVRGGKKCFR